MRELDDNPNQWHFVSAQPSPSTLLAPQAAQIIAPLWLPAHGSGQKQMCFSSLVCVSASDKFRPDCAQHSSPLFVVFSHSAEDQVSTRGLLREGFLRQ